MRNLLLAFVISASSLVSFAARAEMLASIGTSVMFESASNGRNYEQRQPMGVRGGYRFEKFDVLAEYTRFEVTSGSEYVGVVRKHEQLIAWGRFVKKEWRLAPSASLGAGVSMEKVDTRLGGEDRSDSGQAQPLVAAAAGAVLPLATWLDLTLEGRVESSPSQSWRPLLGFSLFAEARF